MRNVHFKRSTHSLYPWGPESTVNGAQYVAAAKALVASGLQYGQTFEPKQLVQKMREVYPELFVTRERGDLTPSEVANRLNMGGKHPELGENKFRLEWFPIQRVYCVIDAAELVELRDVAQMMSRAARSARRIMTEALQMASPLIKALPEEEQQEFVSEYLNQMRELGIIQNWGDNDRLSLLDSVEEKTGQKLGNGNGHQLGDESKLTLKNKK